MRQLLSRGPRGGTAASRSLAFAAGALGLSLLALGAGPEARQGQASVPGSEVIVRAGPPGPPTLVTSALTEAIRARVAVPESSFIDVEYDAGFQDSAEAKAAFQLAVDIWAAQLSSPVAITVRARWSDLCLENLEEPGCTILGSSRPQVFVRDYPGLPRPATWYPVALGNALAGYDIVGESPDMVASFNSGRSDWYYGTDGEAGSSQMDFVTVALHELAHGLGFLGRASYNPLDKSGSVGSMGFEGSVRYPSLWELNVVNAAGAPILSFTSPSTALGSQLTSDGLYWNGPSGTAVNGGVRPKLHAPPTWSEGASYHHLDETTYVRGHPSSLMTPTIGRGEAIHDPGPIGRAVLKDLGWTIGGGPAAPTLTSLAPTAGPVAGGTTVTLAGAGFVSGNTSVSFGGVGAASVKVANAGSLTAVTPAHAAGPVTVAVTTPGGTAALVDGYTFLAPTPAITAFSPGSVRAGSGVFTLAVHGSGFLEGASVEWNGAARETTFVSASEVWAIVLGNDIPGASTVTVSVRNPDGQAASAAYPVTANWRICGAGDLNRDGMSDLVWESADGYLGAWLMNGTFQAATVAFYQHPVAVDGWHCAAVGDLNGDGSSDLVWQHADGYVAGWIMDGTTQVTNGLIFTHPVAVDGWTIVAAGDLDGDRKADLLWQDSRGYVAAWFMDGLSQRKNELLAPGPVDAGWRIVGAGDFNRDGSTDLVWQSADGFAAAWLMNGQAQMDSKLFYDHPVAVSGWSIVAVGDLNSDGHADIVWSTDDGLLGAWLMNLMAQVHDTRLSPGRVY